MSKSPVPGEQFGWDQDACYVERILPRMTQILTDSFFCVNL